MSSTDPHSCSYMTVRLMPEGQTVHRTVEVVENSLLVDLDRDGAVLGIEGIERLIDGDALCTVIRWLRAPQEEAARTSDAATEDREFADPEVQAESLAMAEQALSAQAEVLPAWEPDATPHAAGGDVTGLTTEENL